MADEDDVSTGTTESEQGDDGFTARETATREAAAVLLHDLADSVASGAVAFDDGAAAAHLPETFDLELEYEHEGEVAEIEVELEWPVAAVADADEAPVAGGPAEAGDGPPAPDASGNDPESADAATANVDGLVAPGAEETSRARFELYRDRADEWRWRLVHHNGNIIADSGEGYSRKATARNGLESVKRNAPGATVVETE